MRRGGPGRSRRFFVDSPYVASSTCAKAVAMTHSRAASPRPVWIVGAGAVGLHLAARLAGVTSVTLVARGPRTQALAAAGFSLTGAEERSARVEVVGIAGDWQVPPEAVVLVAVKATQLAETLAALGSRVAPGPLLGLCQNGLGIAELARQAAPGASLVRVACWLGAAL